LGNIVEMGHPPKNYSHTKATLALDVRGKGKALKQSVVKRKRKENLHCQKDVQGASKSSFNQKGKLKCIIFSRRLTSQQIPRNRKCLFGRGNSSSSSLRAQLPFSPTANNGK
jgi:hypothetical protein